ncbi:hypothetical protein LJR010_006039 [Ensifer adhaerens]|uniref:hypothetical protein n=1 Tax=Ensifer adhaerens TaxID=106592 RepID=UPI000DE3B368
MARKTRRPKAQPDLPKVGFALSLPFRVARLAALWSLVVSAWVFSPHVIDAVRIFGIRGDTTAILARAASSNSPEQIRKRAEQALAESDPELAESLSQVAAENGTPFPAQLLVKIDDAKKFSFTRSASEVWKGASTGRADTPTAFATAMAVDLTPVGDARDFAAEISKIPQQDNLTLFLAGAGLVMTANTVITQGAALPIKGGISVLKAAKKLNKLPKSLEEDMVNIATRSIDDEVLIAMKRRAEEFDIGGLAQDARRIVRPDAVRTISEAAGAVYSVSRQGYRATLQTLENAGEIGDLKKLEKAAEKLGPKYRGTLALRGGVKLTLKLAAVLAEIIWILIGVAIWIACVVSTVSSFISGAPRLPIGFRRRSTA